MSSVIDQNQLKAQHNPGNTQRHTLNHPNPGISSASLLPTQEVELENAAISAAISKSNDLTSFTQLEDAAISAAISKSNPLAAFTQKIEQELIQGSAIAPSLYLSAISVCSDLEFNATGEPVTPIHDALNWHYTRFGRQVKSTLYAALFLNEDGTCWQAKLSTPRPNKDKPQQTYKYETPIGNGAKAYLPPFHPRSGSALENAMA
jgi:hypothetical protein